MTDTRAGIHHDSLEVIQVSAQSISENGLDHIPVAHHGIHGPFTQGRVPLMDSCQGSSLHAHHGLPTREGHGARSILDSAPQCQPGQILQRTAGPFTVGALPQAVIGLHGDGLALRCADRIGSFLGALEWARHDGGEPQRPQTRAHTGRLLTTHVIQMNVWRPSRQNPLSIRRSATMAHQDDNGHVRDGSVPVHSRSTAPGRIRLRKGDRMIRIMGLFVDGIITPGSASTSQDGIDASLQARLQDLRTSVRHAGDFVWVAVADPTDAEVRMVAQEFDLQPLLVDDAISHQQRARIDVTPDSLFVLLKVLEWVDDTSDVETGQVACFVGPGYALTVRVGSARDADAVAGRLADHPELAKTGPLSVFWAVADVASQEYLDVGEAIQSDVEEIEQQVFSDHPSQAAARIYRLNRENIEMRRAVQPLLLEAQRLAREDSARIPRELHAYLRDVGDNILRAGDMVDGFDSTLMTMLMASTARQDLLQNMDMRKISAWAAIIAVPTAIAGIYGMNFDDMPELHWTFGYPAVVGVMAIICLLLYRGFKKSGWL